MVGKRRRPSGRFLTGSCRRSSPHRLKRSMRSCSARAAGRANSHTKRDGTQVVVASPWSLQRDEQRHPMAILETNNDITECRRAEEALRESEEQWRTVFENNPTMYFMVDAAGIILSVNPVGAEQFGYTVEELVGHSV